MRPMQATTSLTHLSRGGYARKSDAHPSPNFCLQIMVTIPIMPPSLLLRLFLSLRAQVRVTFSQN
jgi:hypothetical protein